MIRKLLSGLLAGLLTVSLCACGGDDTRGEDSQREAQVSETDRNGKQAQEQETQGQGDAGNPKILIAYFTWAENAVPDENVDATASPSVTDPGHVGQLARWVQEETGGDLFSIRVTEPYSSDWDECLDRANGENRDNIHPELEAVLESTADYDTVFIGYPNWWYSCPMAIFSFIDEHDLAGKDIYLFCSHGTGGLAGRVEDISAALPDSNVSDNVFDVYEEDAPSAREELLDWLSGIRF